MNIVFKDFDFTFDDLACRQCGAKCCRGEEGYIWLNKNEMIKIAEILQITFEELTSKYIKKVGFKYSIIEKKLPEGDFGCIFLDEQNRCKIYSARPAQCVSFPFWESFKNKKDEVKKECIGVI